MTLHWRHLLPWALVAAGAAIAAIAYLQALHYLFLSDDTVYITENSRLAALHPNELWRLLVEPYNRYSEFLPLRELSYWLEIRLFGMNAAAFRADNILLYLLCLPLVYANTAGLWKYFRPADSASAPWAAAAVTVLFALQPSHAEAVVWISGRKDVLSTLFSLLAIGFAINAKRGQGLSAPHAAAALAALLAAMLAKASAFAVAPVIAMLWLMFWRDIAAPNRRNILLLWPLVAVIIAACMALVFATIIPTKTPFYFGVQAVIRSLAVLGWLARLSVSPESRHFFYPVLEDAYLPMMVVLGAAVLSAAAVSAVVMLRKRPSLEEYAVIAFFLLCVPSIQLIPYQPPSLVSDRWLALAVWPAGMLIVALAWRLKPAPRATLLLAIALSWSVQTMERPRDWRSLQALVDADIRAFPGYYLPAEHKIVYVQLKNGLRADAVETAREISSQPLREMMIKLIDADYAVKVIAAATGDPQAAMTQLSNLEQEFNPPAEISWNSGMRNFWSTIGFALMDEWEYLAKQFPDAAPVRYDAGLWMLRIHKYPEAAVQFRAAAESGNLPVAARGTAYRNLGLALTGAGDAAAAEAPLRAALLQSPPDFRAYCTLAEVYRRSGRQAEAARAEADCRSHAAADAMAQ